MLQTFFVSTAVFRMMPHSIKTSELPLLFFPLLFFVCFSYHPHKRDKSKTKKSKDGLGISSLDSNPLDQIIPIIDFVGCISESHKIYDCNAFGPLDSGPGKNFR